VVKLQTEILHDRVHSSAVTEGNRLSRRETIVVLTSGLVEAGAKRDELEVRNLAEAILLLEEALEQSQDLTVHFLRQLHATVMRDFPNCEPGSFRGEDVVISGAKVNPPSHMDVPAFVEAVLNANGKLEGHALQRAAWLHWAIARIHPFKDGNGRISRLLQDYVLLAERCVPSALTSADREGQYYEALEQADFGEGNDLLEIVAANTLRMADRYLAIINDFKEKHSFLANIVAAVNENVKATDHRRFLAVQRASNLLKAEVFELAKGLDAEIPSLSIRSRDFGSLEFDQFKEIENWGSSKKTWFIGLEFKIENTMLRYIIWYGSHKIQPSDSFTESELPSKVVLLVSHEEERQYYKTLDESEDRVSLRELVPNGSSFWRRRFNPVEKVDEWDRDLQSGIIVRELFSEILGKLGLV
jgi:Fic family protein